MLEPSLPVQLSNSNTCAPVSDRTTLARRSWSPLEKEDGEISDEEPERFSLEGVHVSLGDWTAGPPECCELHRGAWCLYPPPNESLIQ